MAYQKKLKAKKVRTDRYDNLGKIKKICEAEGYVMARRPGCMPFVIPLGSWELLPFESEEGLGFKRIGNEIFVGEE